MRHQAAKECISRNWVDREKDSVGSDITFHLAPSDEEVSVGEDWELLDRVCVAARVDCHFVDSRLIFKQLQVSQISLGLDE